MENNEKIRTVRTAVVHVQDAADRTDGYELVSSVVSFLYQTRHLIAANMMTTNEKYR